MKKIKILFFTLLFFFCPIFFVNALPVIFTQTYFTKIQYGKLGEYVYDQKDSSSPYVKLSYLDWPKKFIFNTGTKFQADCKNFILDASFSFAIPGSSGILQDYDYLNFDDTLICYSKSQNTLEQNINSEITFYYKFGIDRFLIEPLICFCFNDVYFSARNGYGWYGNNSSPYVSYDDSSAAYYSELCGISYQRQTFYTWLGLKTLCNAGKFKFALAYSISPFTYIYSIDKHFTDLSSNNFRLYNDRMTGIFSWHKLALDAEYELKTDCFIKFALASVFGKSSLGETYFGNGNIHSSETEVSLITSKSMADEITFDASFSIKFIF